MYGRAVTRACLAQRPPPAPHKRKEWMTGSNHTHIHNSGCSTPLIIDELHTTSRANMQPPARAPASTPCSSPTPGVNPQATQHSRTHPSVSPAFNPAVGQQYSSLHPLLSNKRVQRPLTVAQCSYHATTMKQGQQGWSLAQNSPSPNTHTQTPKALTRPVPTHTHCPLTVRPATQHPL